LRLFVSLLEQIHILLRGGAMPIFDIPLQPVQPPMVPTSWRTTTGAIRFAIMRERDLDDAATDLTERAWRPEGSRRTGRAGPLTCCASLRGPGPVAPHRPPRARSIASPARH